MVGLEAEIDVSEVPEAVDGEAGSGKEGERQREFADDKNSAQEMLGGAGAGAATLFESLRGIDPGCVPGGSGAGEKASEGGRGKSEQQDGNVEAQIGLGGEGIARHRGDEALQHGIAEADAKCSAGEGEHEAFGKSWAKMVLRPAPSALRTASSFCRAMPRASSRLATLTQAMRSTKPTAPRRSQSILMRSLGRKSFLSGST